MLEIASALSYAEFNGIKSLESAKKMWDALKTIYGGDKNVQRAKLESLRVSLMKWKWKKVRLLPNMLLESKKLLVQLKVLMVQ